MLTMRLLASRLTSAVVFLSWALSLANCAARPNHFSRRNPRRALPSTDARYPDAQHLDILDAIRRSTLSQIRKATRGTLSSTAIGFLCRLSSVLFVLFRGWTGCKFGVGWSVCAFGVFGAKCPEYTNIAYMFPSRTLHYALYNFFMVKVG